MSWNLVLPDFAFADDAEMEQRLPSLDGRWTEQTKELLRLLGATRLELNANWAANPTDWICPVCRRRKTDIARLTPAGVLLCQLDSHHDHLGDEGARLLWRAQEAHADRSRRDAISSAVQACRALGERFHPMLVCNDCNTADGHAKTELKGVVHPQFSFAPSEIAQFVRVAPNRIHDIDFDAALKIWNAVEEDVTDRLAFMEVMTSRIASGRHAREGSAYQAPLLVTAMNDLLGTGGLPWRGHAVLSAIHGRSVKRDGFGSSVKTAPRRAAAPTPEDLARFTAGLTSNNFWHAPPDDWHCEACLRSRLEILRKSPKSGLWTAGAHRRRVFTVETRPDALWRRHGWYDGGLIYGDHATVWICKDCRQVITDTKQTGQHLSDDCLSVQDVRDLLASVRPHERPEYDRQAAAQRAVDNLEAMAAVEEYDEHRRQCLDLFYNRRHLLRSGSEADVDQWQMDATLWRAHVGPEQRRDQLAWLLAEGERYAAANARDRWPPNTEEPGYGSVHR